jgi:hypothetical protein
MNGIFQAAAEIQGVFETRQWQFAIIGEPNWWSI